MKFIINTKYGSYSALPEKNRRESSSDSPIPIAAGNDNMHNPYTGYYLFSALYLDIQY